MDLIVDMLAAISLQIGTVLGTLLSFCLTTTDIGKSLYVSHVLSPVNNNNNNNNNKYMYCLK